MNKTLVLKNKMTDSNLEPVKEENIVECRACLQEINSDCTYYNLFDCVGQQEQMRSTIAEKLSNIAHIEISEADELPKVICDMCCTLLQSAHSFAVTVRKTDELLRQKFANVQKESENVWPKPIQISNNIDTHYIPHTEIKEEVLSEDECFAKQDSDEHNISKVEIKVESSSQDCEPNIPKINEICSLNNMQIECLESVNDEMDEIVEPKENTAIKEEPQSEEEMESVESLDCMLCTKTFNSVSGLKAHVITQHSYKGVKRKSDNTVSPKKVKYTYICETCRRAFATSTDLMVHETCHNKCKCYLCYKSFPTFRDLSQHRLTCRESKTPDTYLKKPESSKVAPKPNIGTMKPTTEALKPRTTEATKTKTTTETTKQKKYTKFSPKPKITTDTSESSDSDSSESRKYVSYSRKRKSTKEVPISPNTTELTIPNNTMESQLQITERDTPVKQEKKSKKRRSLEINIRISH